MKIHQTMEGQATSSSKELKYSCLAFVVLLVAQGFAGLYYLVVLHDTAGYFLILAAILPAILLSPYLMKIRNFDLFSPLTLFAASVTIGCTFRITYIVAYRGVRPRAEFFDVWVLVRGVGLGLLMGISWCHLFLCGIRPKHQACGN